MKLSRTMMVLFLLLSGCGSCQRSEDAPPTAPGAAAQKGTGGGSPAPMAPSGKIQVNPVAPAGGGVPNKMPAAQNAPEAPAAAGGHEPAENEEGDCIVVADANPDYGPPPLAVAFSAEAECNPGQPTYNWDFGDGSPHSAEANPSHTYTQPGDYTASVTVTASGGATASDEIDITVEEEEGEPQQ